MIVCSCNALAEPDVRSAARAGSATPEACYAQEIIDEERARAGGGRAMSNVVRLRTAA